jgi:GNAT superfamily N-acetyltransferase
MTTPSSPPAVRRAAAGDADAIANLWHESWHETHTPDPFRNRAWFRQRSLAIVPSAYVAVRDGKVVGFSAWDHDMLTHLFVSRGEYGRGTADLLLTAAEDALASEGVSRASLHCREADARALRFYEKRNWRKEGLILEDVWRLDKTLSPHDGKAEAGA